MSSEQNYKDTIKSARDMVEQFPGQSAAELTEMTAQEILYPNRSNEKYVNEALIHIRNAIELVIDHPNSLDGILARKLEQRASEHHQNLLANPQLLAELTVSSFAHQISQLLDQGPFTIENWRNFGDKFIDHPAFKDKLSGNASDEFAEIFMSVHGMKSQDAFVYFMENVTEEKSPALYSGITAVSTDQKQSAVIKV